MFGCGCSFSFIILSFYVLHATAVVTAVLHLWVDTGVIVGVVVINAIIGFIQESKAEQAIESLKEVLAPSAIALRDGKKASVPAAELVPGDLWSCRAVIRSPPTCDSFKSRTCTSTKLR